MAQVGRDVGAKVSAVCQLGMAVLSTRMLQGLAPEVIRMELASSRNPLCEDHRQQRRTT
jgi:hypothetical protein